MIVANTAALDGRPDLRARGPGPDPDAGLAGDRLLHACRSTSTSRATPTWRSAWARCSASTSWKTSIIPTSADSITDFWRRWHISLSSWFRDYLYIPLGGNRCSPLRVYFNLMTVFFLCGLWHGASWNFIALGVYHGAFPGRRAAVPPRVLEATPAILRHAYALLAVMVGWVLFRTETLGGSRSTTSATMFGARDGRRSTPNLAYYLSPKLSSSWRRRPCSRRPPSRCWPLAPAAVSATRRSGRGYAPARLRCLTLLVLAGLDDADRRRAATIRSSTSGSRAGHDAANLMSQERETGRHGSGGRPGADRDLPDGASASPPPMRSSQLDSSPRRRAVPVFAAPRLERPVPPGALRITSDRPSNISPSTSGSDGSPPR